MDATQSILGKKPMAKRKIARWLFGIGVSLMLVGGCWAVGNSVWCSTRTWTPVDTPLALTVGHRETPEFTVNVAENFAIDLTVDRSVPRDLMTDVLGIGDPLSSQRGERSGFRLAWTVEGGGRVVKNGISDGKDEGYWGSKTGRRLGYFPADKGKLYKVKIDILEDGTKLAPYHPCLKVGVDMFRMDGYYIETAGMQIIGGGIAVVGCLFFIAALVRWRTPRGEVA
jgi:hypothetical protein